MNVPFSALCDQNGIFLRREALAVGFDDRAIANAVRTKLIHRVRHGAYVMWRHWEELSEKGRHLTRAAAILRTTKTKVALSHVTALACYDAPLWDLPLGDVHLTRLDRRIGRREAGVAQHCGVLPPEDVAKRNSQLVTCATRTALDLTTITDVEHALPAIDHLLHTGETDIDSLRKKAKAMVHAPGSLSTDLVLRLTDGRHESVGESRSGYMFWRGGLPKPQPQYKILDYRGEILARVDFAWPEYGVFLEFDGKEKYVKYRKEGESVVDAVLREKKREELICRITGWRCIRIAWADLYTPEVTVARIRAVLAGGPVH
ncbi:MAG: hypothetical protein JWR90_3574 [Marmoricola sp.]|jgi:hypothetical protein|nr:hypothetical protein [Marmoricola sp.]